MEIFDKLRLPTGILHLRVVDHNGVELWRESDHNLIVANGYKAAAEALAGISASRISFVAIGTNGTEPKDDDTTITDDVTVEVQKIEFPKASTVRFNFSIGYEVAIGMQIREFGLITADGRLFSRKVRETIEKTQYMSIVGQWDINI